MAKTKPLPIDIDYDRFKGHLRPHFADEHAHLEASLKAEGCRDDLIIGVLDEQRYLIDGFNRKALCDELNIKYRTREITFESEEEVLIWIERNALARRNLTHTERKYYIGRRYNKEKKGDGSDNLKKGQDLSPGGQVGPPEEKTCERIAQEENISARTVKRNGKLADALDEACQYGLDFLKWPILAERIKCTGDGKKLVNHLNHLGAGGCQETVERLLADSPEKPVTEKAIFKALVQDDPMAPSPEDKAGDQGKASRRPKKEWTLTEASAAMDEYGESILQLEALERLDALDALTMRLKAMIIRYERRIQEATDELNRS